jgi:cation diffusion facilitator CzcD-associated flavoprotein CzcO
VKARVDLVIVGAGFAGMYMLHRARQLGLTAQVFEAASGVGGTWYWNRYPGARCDVESMEYSYQFDEALQQEWRWSERFATQPEILRYANHVADRFDLRKDIRFDTRVVAASYADGRWVVRTEKADEVSARFLVMATGCLSTANRPDIPGFDEFRGAVYHTGEWPHEEPDFTGQRVGVIGTGSSAIQSIPLLAAQAKQLVVFQRTANYTVPAKNAPLPADVVARIKADYPAFRARNSLQINAFGSHMPRSPIPARELSPAARRAALEARWEYGGLFFLGAFGDLLLDQAANDEAAEFVREKIRGVVTNPAVAQLLSPRQIIGCKRLCVDTGYYATFNRPNVRLVDISAQGIQRITPDGVRANGEAFALDALVFATGFDAMTGTLLRMDIRGRDGRTLRDAWQAGPRTYLGLSVAGFPNLFLVTGPGSPSVLTNMIVSIEQHVNWIADCIAHLGKSGRATIEARPDAQEAWVAHVNAVADRTLYPMCNSWYVGANIPGKTRVFMPLLGYPAYVEKCNEVAARGYEGFQTN